MTYQPTPGPADAAPPYAPRVVRPPLTARAKRGAALGEAIGFPLLTLGYALVAIPIALAVIIAFFALIVRTASGSASSANAGFEQFISGIDLARWIVPVVVSALVGIMLMVASIVLSGRVLRAHDVRRPWAVTWAVAWAGAGIAVVGWLSWWWMAHAMRPVPAVAPGPGTPPPVPGA